MNFRVKESENWPTEEDLEPHVYANGRFDIGDYLHVEWQVFMKDNLPKKAIPFVKLNQSEISKNRWGRDTFFCEIWNMSGGRFSMIDIQKLTTAEYYKITHELEEMENVWNGKYNESRYDSRKRIQEAQANMAYYGFKRVPERDFSDDGTRFFMWVWDPEDTGHSPFYFSKAGGYDMVFFSEHFGSNIHQECRKHGYNNLDDLNGISKSAFTDEALGKIVAQLQSIRESDWFESICPEFSTRGAIEQGIEVKDYNADKDHQRVMDFAKRAGGDTEKMVKLAANMAKAIKDEEKMRSRWQAAVDIYGSESPVAKAFEAQANANRWRINIRPRSGDIDWSSLFESTIRENVKDESIYNAHAEYEKDQLKKKEEEDNQENFTFDEGSVKLATVVKESEERKYWNNFFDKLTESADTDRTEDLLKDYFDTIDVELSDETCWGLPVYIVDNKRYAVGDADEAYEAAVKQAINVYEDDTDEGKINWLQEHHWPGVDERGVCEACGDDPDDYEEGETIYQPSSIDEYIETMGFSQASDAFSMAFLGDYINKHEIGEYVVDNDGVGALASEDGNEISIGDDLSAFCLGRAY